MTPDNTPSPTPSGEREEIAALAERLHAAANVGQPWNVEKHVVAAMDLVDAARLLRQLAAPAAPDAPTPEAKDERWLMRGPQEADFADEAHLTYESSDFDSPYVHGVYEAVRLGIVAPVIEGVPAPATDAEWLTIRLHVSDAHHLHRAFALEYIAGETTGFVPRILKAFADAGRATVGATVVTEQPPVCVYCLKHGDDVLFCAAPGEPIPVWAHVACAAAPICHSCNVKRADAGMATCHSCRNWNKRVARPDW